MLLVVWCDARVDANESVMNHVGDAPLKERAFLAASKLLLRIQCSSVQASQTDFSHLLQARFFSLPVSSLPALSAEFLLLAAPLGEGARERGAPGNPKCDPSNLVSIL